MQQSKRSRQEDIFGKELTKRGIWYKQTVTLTAGAKKQQVDFVLKSAKRKVVIEIDGPERTRAIAARLSKDLLDSGYAVHRFSVDIIDKDPKAAVALVIRKFNPITVSQNNRAIVAEMKAIRELFEAATASGHKMKRLPTKERNGNGATDLAEGQSRPTQATSRSGRRASSVPVPAQNRRERLPHVARQRRMGTRRSDQAREGSRRN